ncbi:MAG: sigma-70 family RNA polymerase sigma factor [Myxococcota bacterium]
MIRARGGDRSAFEALHDRYARVVHGVLLAKVPPGIASDLVQDTFVAVLERLGGLRDEGAFGGWVLAIARNLATDWHRSSRKVVALDEVPERGAEPRPTAEAEQVLAAIRALPETYAVPLTLRLVEGLTGPEIAERLGMTPGSVRVNLHKGMKRLREELGVADE